MADFFVIAWSLELPSNKITMCQIIFQFRIKTPHTRYKSAPRGFSFNLKKLPGLGGQAGQVAPHLLDHGRVQDQRRKVRFRHEPGKDKDDLTFY